MVPPNDNKNPFWYLYFGEDACVLPLIKALKVLYISGI